MNKSTIEHVAKALCAAAGYDPEGGGLHGNKVVSCNWLEFIDQAEMAIKAMAETDDVTDNEIYTVMMAACAVERRGLAKNQLPKMVLALRNKFKVVRRKKITHNILNPTPPT